MAVCAEKNAELCILTGSVLAIFRDRFWRIAGRYQYSDNTSTIDAYNYGQNVFSVSADWSF